MTSLIGKPHDMEICLKQHNSTKGGLCNNRKWWQAKFILGYSTICFLIGLLYGLKILILLRRNTVKLNMKLEFSDV